MHYKSALIGKVFFIRWTDQSTVDDVRSAFKDIDDAYRRAGTKLVHIAILHKTLSAPPADVRQELVKSADEIDRRCAVLSNVVDGEGFRASIQRSMLAGVLMASRRNAKVHASVEAALRDVAVEHKLDVPEILAKAKEAGIVD